MAGGGAAEVCGCCVVGFDVDGLCRLDCDALDLEVPASGDADWRRRRRRRRRLAEQEGGRAFGRECYRWPAGSGRRRATAAAAVVVVVEAAAGSSAENTNGALGVRSLCSDLDRARAPWTAGTPVRHSE